MADTTTARTGQHDDDLEARVRAKYGARFGWPLPPIAGAQEPDDEDDDTQDADETTETPDPPKEGEDDSKTGDEKPEGEDAGEKLKSALKKERTAAREARAKVREHEATIAQLREELEGAKASGEKVAELEDEVASLNAKLGRYEVAAEKGIDLKLAARLSGSTREELEADADEFLASISGSGSFDGGARVTPPQKKDPMKEHGRFVAALLRGETPSED